MLHDVQNYTLYCLNLSNLVYLHKRVTIPLTGFYFYLLGVAIATYNQGCLERFNTFFFITMVPRQSVFNLSTSIHFHDMTHHGPTIRCILLH